MPDATLPQPTPLLCCEESLAAGEPLTATTPRTDVWLLLEYNAGWGAKALPESKLSEALKAYLDRQLAAIPNSRFQFIRQEGKSTDRDGISFYVAVSHPSHPALYRFLLPDHEHVLALDIAAIAAGKTEYQASYSDDSLFLVCTNGRRDLSCARYGIALYQAMSAANVWQTTHIGGHRFAGTLVVLPFGLYYGRVRPHEARDLMDAHRAGLIDLAHYRGRSAYDAPVQAADHFLRQHTGQHEINALKLLASAKRRENLWTVRFELDGQTHVLSVSGRLSDFETRESTGDDMLKRVMQYDVALETGRV